MKLKIFTFVLCLLVFYKNIFSAPVLNLYKQSNDIPPRLQWTANAGYCGEVSLISAGLYYGQYISQYDARAIATHNAPQNKRQLLLGVNDQYAAKKMHLNAVVWDTGDEQDTNAFLVWVKQYVIQGHPVIIGIYTNEYLFYNNTNPNAGDEEYDHIVPVTGFLSKHPLKDHHYYKDNVIYFSDNGLWGSIHHFPYFFHYRCGVFQKNRQQANAMNGPIYSLSNSGKNYGIVIIGVMDLNRETLPVRINTNVNYEKPSIVNGSTIRPKAMPLILTVTISHLKPNVAYILYKYNNIDAVPNAAFNAHAHNAKKSWKIQIKFGSTYSIKDYITSNEMAIYRAVKASAK